MIFWTFRPEISPMFWWVPCQYTYWAWHGAKLPSWRIVSQLGNTKNLGTQLVFFCSCKLNELEKMEFCGRDASKIELNNTIKCRLSKHRPPWFHQRQLTVHWERLVLSLWQCPDSYSFCYWNDIFTMETRPHLSVDLNWGSFWMKSGVANFQTLHLYMPRNRTYVVTINVCGYSLLSKGGDN